MRLDLNVQAAWDQGITGKNVTTAIMDDGTCKFIGLKKGLKYSLLLLLLYVLIIVKVIQNVHISIHRQYFVYPVH